MLVVGAAVGLSACGTTLTLPPYTPVTTAELDGATQVDQFKYFPKSNVAPDVIHNTAAGEIHVTDSVPDYITNAVRRELRQAGVSLKPESKCKLDGEVNDFTIDDLGFSVDWLSNIRYILWDADGKPLLDNDFQTKFHTDKFQVAALLLASVNKMISDNVAQLIADPAFQKALREHCQKP
jgi:uncharacterized lipoprotein